MIVSLLGKKRAPIDAICDRIGRIVSQYRMSEGAPEVDESVSRLNPIIDATHELLLRRARLDDPIVRFLPEGAAVWPRVTVRHLLTHTSGIPQDTTLDWVRGGGLLLRRRYAQEPGMGVAHDQHDRGPWTRLQCPGSGTMGDRPEWWKGTEPGRAGVGAGHRSS